MKQYVVLLIAILYTLPAFAGDHPAPLHMTGNPQVDFFSMRDFMAPRIGKDSTPTFSQMTTEPAESKKSPWLAAGMSLIIPGSGEVYSGSYTKGAVFFGIEIGSLITAYIYNKKGDDQTIMFQHYADQNWSPVRYALWTYHHSSILNPNVNPDDFDLFPNQDIDTIQNLGHPPTFDNIDWGALRAYESAIASGNGSNGQPNGYTHQLPYYGEQQYYELIGKYEEYYSGWKDANINEAPGLSFNAPENSMFKIYSRMRAQANNYYDVASTMMSIVIINHVVSAIDAAWTAAMHNKHLEAHADVRLEQTPFGVVPIKEANITWTF